jgi:ribosome-associated translation inhibitor RaiA
VRHILCDIYDRRSELSRSQMQIRVDADEHIDSNEDLASRVEGVVEGSLERYRDRVVLVRVHLSRLAYASGRMHHGAGERDMCCRMEAEAGLLTPIVVTHEAITLTEAIHAASAKLERAVHDALRRDKSQEAQDAGQTESLGHVGSS